MMVRIGDVVPWERPKSIFGEQLKPPAWFILRTPPQREGAAKTRLELHGVAKDTMWFPTETVWHKRRGARRDRVAVAKRIAPGYLFVRFEHEPVWHVLWDLTEGLVSGVVGLDGIPFAAPDQVIARMKQVPERIEWLRTAAAEREAAERAARAPAAGQRAKLTDGPLAGMIVDVQSIDRGIAAFLLEGIKGSAQVSTMERIDR